MKIINYLFYIIFIILILIIIKDLCYSNSNKYYYEFYDDNIPSNPNICNSKYTCSTDKKCVPDPNGTYNDFDSCDTNCKVDNKVSPSLNKNNNNNNNNDVLTSVQSSEEILYQKPYNNTICADTSTLSDKENCKWSSCWYFHNKKWRQESKTSKIL